MNQDEQDLHDEFARLADPSLPAGLDARIWAARQRQVRRGFGIAGIAVAAALLAVGLALQPHPGARSPGEPVAARAVPATPRTGDAIADIRVIDHALQVAYARNASEDEVAPLWDARKQLLQRLRVPSPAPGFI